MIHTWSLHQRGSNPQKYSTLIYNFCHVCPSQYRVGIDSPSVVVGLHLHLSRIHNEVVCVQLNPWKKLLSLVCLGLSITLQTAVSQKGLLIYWLNKVVTIKIKALTWPLLFSYCFHWSDLDTCPPSSFDNTRNNIRCNLWLKEITGLTQNKPVNVIARPMCFLWCACLIWGIKMEINSVTNKLLNIIFCSEL